MQTSIVSKSKLERTLRIDGEYYQSKYLDIEKKIFAMQNIKPITELCKVSDGNHMSIAQYFNTDEGVPYYRGQDITDFFLENVTPVIIILPKYSGLLKGSSIATRTNEFFADPKNEFVSVVILCDSDSVFIPSLRVLRN